MGACMHIYIHRNAHTWLQESLRLELKEKRQELMKQLKEHGASTQEMETQIFAAGCKLRTLMEENDKIESVSLSFWHIANTAGKIKI